MSEHPILFSAPMVRAILAGTKTQTRRVIRSAHAQEADAWQDCGSGRWESGIAGDHGRYGHGEWVRCPYGFPGDLLFVRETWQAIHVFVDPETGCGDGMEYSTTVPVSDRDGWWTPVYAATDPQASDHRDDRGFPWRPAIHMPRWASRITLEVTGVRVERVQEITEADAQAEGMLSLTEREVAAANSRGGAGRTWTKGPAHARFELLWDTINGKAGRRWADNPWVWVIAFRRVQP